MTSFRKRTIQKPIRGTRTSPHTAQVITSSGNPSLDVILGGGLPIGSICLIEEDLFTTHAKVLAKCFIAEGVLSKQEVFLGSLDDKPAEMLRHLPKPLTEEEAELEQQQEKEYCDQKAAGDKNGLRIAWRYSDLPLVNSEQSHAKIGHHFNLMERMDSMMLYYAQTNVWDDSYKELDILIQEEHSKSSSSSSSLEQEQAQPETAAVQYADNIEGANNTASNNNNNPQVANNPTESSTEVNIGNCTPISSAPGPVDLAPRVETNHQIFYNPRYGRLLNDVHELLRDASFIPGQNTQQKNLCRVCLTGVGSALWFDDNFADDLIKFLTILRASVRSCNSVCLITMPMSLIAKYDINLVLKIRQLVDYAIELESFAGSNRETNPAFKEYSGLLHLHKMTALNTLAVHMPETTDLAFKLRRKKFVIEKLHLPPELQESPASPITAADIGKIPSCSGSGSNITFDINAPLDF